MANYTYEQFEAELKNSGMFNQFSTADLELARKNPDAGMSLLQYKRDYANATTDEARALAHLGAEGVRSSYGNYTGGSDGSSFYLDPLSPSSFDTGTAPTYTNNYEKDIADLYAQQKNYGSFNYGIPAPEYDNRYDETIQKMLDDLINREAFSYDPETDPLYSQYRKQYTREGQRATQDALGAAAAATGGIPSSYAATAATQAGDYYSAQMTDKIPELYQLAYNKYLNDYNMQLSDLGAVQGAEQNDYDKFLNELTQWNTDRNFDYNAWMDEYNRIANDLQTASGLEQLEYTKFLNDLNQYNADRQFNYGVLLDEINSQTQERSEAMEKALTAAQYGDYSFLQGMGIDTSNNPTDWERRYNLALLGAEYGDLSGLQGMGINTNIDPAEWERQYTLALLAAEYGDFSGLEALGIAPNAANLNAFNTTVTGKTGNGGAGYDNGGYSSEEIKALQKALGVDADGKFGANSAAAMEKAGYNSIEAAYNALVGAGGLSDADIAIIKQSYPSGVVTNQGDWDYLVDIYGEEALKAAGITMQGAAEDNQTPGAGEDPAPGAGDLASVTDYDSAIAYMKAAGVDGSVRSGLMTRSEWSRRKASLQQYGTGGAEVKNYNSYAEYVKAYCEYASGK